MPRGDRSEDAGIRSDALERVSDGVLATDSEFRYTHVNQQVERMLGMGADELLGRRPWEVFPGVSETDAESYVRAAMETQEPQSYERYNEELDCWFDVRIYPDDAGLSIYLHDVTERKRSERELERTNQLLTALVENTGEAVYVKDLDGTYQLLNEAAAQFFGLDPAEAIGKADVELFDAESEDALRASDRRVVTTGEPETRETTLYIDGDKHVFLDNKYPYRDESGEIVGVMGIARDVTERVHRERELEQKNERLDEFASVIAHDLRSPLNVAQGHTEFLAAGYEGEPPVQLTAVSDALDRMERIVEDTLTLAREGETVGETDPVALDALLTECWDLTTANGATLEVDELGTVEGDDERLRHVFENLFRNAIEHGGEDVTVRVGRTDDHRLYVTDDGPGIPPDEREQVFAPGHTTTPGGTGFGLAIVRRIAEAHGWQVAVTDDASGGTRVEFSDVRFVD